MTDTPIDMLTDVLIDIGNDVKDGLTLITALRQYKANGRALFYCELGEP